MSDELDQLLRAARPEPSAALRARILVAAATVERMPPWWARVRTWAAAALLLFTVDAIVMQRSHVTPTAPAPTTVHVDEAISPFPALALAAAPRSESRNAPTPLSNLEEIHP